MTLGAKGGETSVLSAVLGGAPPCSPSLGEGSPRPGISLPDRWAGSPTRRVPVFLRGPTEAFAGEPPYTHPTHPDHRPVMLHFPVGVGLHTGHFHGCIIFLQMETVSLFINTALLSDIWLIYTFSLMKNTVIKFCTQSPLRVLEGYLRIESQRKNY